MIQLERELEGDEFEGKEAFVTQAYKDQMAEVRRAEEEEKRREGTL
jgi:coiled-coil domain-containing protein 55